MSMSNTAELIGGEVSKTPDQDELRVNYLEALNLIERLHRQLLDVIKDDLERSGQPDINSVQALLLFNIGDSELTAGELRTRGHYLGSNVSYNLKKLVEAGYIHHARSDSDRRSVRVSLTATGRDICDRIDALYNHHTATISKVGGVESEDLTGLNKTLNVSNGFGPTRSVIDFKRHFPPKTFDQRLPSGSRFSLLLSVSP